MSDDGIESGMQDIKLSPHTPTVDLPPESPPSPPPSTERRPSYTSYHPPSPPPFQFPTPEQAKQYQQQSQPLDMTLEDDAGTFQSVALGDSQPTPAQGWSANNRLDPQGEDPPTAVDPDAHHSPNSSDASTSSTDDHQQPTPPLSESTLSAPTTESSTKDSPPTSTEDVAMDLPAESTTTTTIPVSKFDENKNRPRKNSVAPTKGATLLQKTISMTRQRDLPPKDREQEVRSDEVAYSLEGES
ncbi:hypothetical protein P7C70_g7255, partial [Phenoliferia sp. Uapishka_3]